MIVFRYRSTNCFLLPAGGGDGLHAFDAGRSLLAFDLGWPCSIREYARAMKERGFRIAQVRWAIVSHFHLDHAGLARDFQDAGIECLLFENQGGGIEAMERAIAPKYPGYRPILRDRFTRLETAVSRAFLKGIGIGAEVVATPGHSDDSVTLVTDSGEALIGDLYPIDQVMPDDGPSLASWARIRALGGRMIYPSHAAPFEL